MFFISRLVCTGTVLLLVFPVFAEGGNKRAPGDWGVNRRVITPDSYSGVSGSCSMSFGVPLESSGVNDWSKNKDSPTFYLGGHGDYIGGDEAEVDAGLQYDLTLDRNRKRGFWCFLRNTNQDTAGDPSKAYCSLQYYDDTLQDSVLWTSGTNLSGGDTTASFSSLSYYAFLDYRIDETTGVISLGYDGLGPTQAAPNGSQPYIGSGTVYWAASGSSFDVKTSLDGQTLQGATEIVVAQNSLLNDMVPGLTITIGTPGTAYNEPKAITAVDYSLRKITLDSPLAYDHDTGADVVFQLSGRLAHSGVNRGPWAGSPVFDTTSKNSWHVKRVVGMTRKTGNVNGSFGDKMASSSVLDDSWMDCTFSNGLVRQVGTTTFHDWGLGDVDQSTHADLNDTGYDARSNPADPRDAALLNNKALVYDQRISTKAHPMPPADSGEKSANSKTIIEFANLTESNEVARGNSPASQQAKDASTNQSRYTKETVRINLRKTVGVGAGAVAPTR